MITDPSHPSPPSSPELLTAFLPYLPGFLPLVKATGDGCDGLFAEISEHNVATLYPLHSARVAEEINLRYEAFNTCAEDEFLTQRLLRDLLDGLKAKAHKVADRRPVYKRLAWVPATRTIWLDLSRPDGLCVRITADGWSLTVPAQPLFVRFATQRPLPVPERSQDGYAAFVRLLPPGMSPESQKLLLGTLLGCLIPSNFAASFSYPVLVVRGDPGSGKSTLSKLIKVLLDNEIVITAAKPAKTDDLYIIGQTSHLLSFDNLDPIRGQISDAICQLTTGSAVTKRRLYTDSDLTILKAHCALLLNGISPLLQRQDIIDRSVTIALSRIEHYDADAGSESGVLLHRVMGLLLDLMSRALANYATTHLDHPPRLATVAKVVAAAEPFGCPVPFATLLSLNQSEVLASADEHDPVLEALFELLASTASWRGTYKDLLATLATKASSQSMQSEEWPKTPKKLSGLLAGRLRMLRELGIEIVPGPKHNVGRLVTVKRTAAFKPDKPNAATALIDLFVKA